MGHMFIRQFSIQSAWKIFLCLLLFAEAESVQEWIQEVGLGEWGVGGWNGAKVPGWSWTQATVKRTQPSHMAHLLHQVS